jgi:hypothetical protein
MLARQGVLRSGDPFVDVGANIGADAILAGDVGARIRGDVETKVVTIDSVINHRIVADMTVLQSATGRVRLPAAELLASFGYQLYRPDDLGNLVLVYDPSPAAMSSLRSHLYLPVERHRGLAGLADQAGVDADGVAAGRSASGFQENRADYRS